MESRKQQGASTDSMDAMKKVSEMVKENSAGFEVAAAREVFQSKCSLCHSSDLALDKSFESADEVSQLVTRMVGNGLVASMSEFEQIVRFLQQHHNLASTTTEQTGGDATDVASNVTEMPTLALQSGCTGCHAIDSKLVGPAWMDVAGRYRDDSQGRQQLIEVVRNGGAGNWTDQTGGIPMPANFPQVSQEDIETLVDFILALP